MTSQLDDIVYGEIAADIASYFDRHPKLGEFVVSNTSELADCFVDSFVSINTIADDRIIKRFNVVKISSSGVGHSQRLGNILINWREILRDAPGIVLTGVGAAGNIYLLILAAAAIAIQLHGHTQVSFERVHVDVIKSVLLSAKGSPPSLEADKITSLCIAEGYDEVQIHKAIDDLCKYSVARLTDGVFLLEEKIEIAA